MTLLSAHKLVRNIGRHTVLDGLSLTISEGDRVGLIGRNGAGKSTLIRCLNDVDPPDAGHIIRRKHLTVSVVEQVPNLNPDLTVGDAVLVGLKTHNQLSQELQRLETQMLSADSNELDELIQRQAELGETLERLGGRAFVHRADAILDALSAPPKDRLLGTLSLGEARRVALAVGLLPAADLLILDEPTNHLDIATIEWLENYLQSYQGGMLLVTHDRHFLDKVTNRIAELDRGELHLYQGAYTQFIQKKAEREAIAAKAETNRQRAIRDELEWVRRGPAARTTKSKSRLQRFEEMVQDTPKAALGEAKFRLPHPARMGKTILEIRQLSKAYGEKKLIQDLDLILTKGARIGIVGENGAGKSTLLKMILGEIQPDAGTIIHGINTQVVYADQGRTQINPEKTVIEEVAEGGDTVFIGEHPVQVQSFLEGLLFDATQQRAKIGTLSGGERTRVALAKQLKRSGNLLILDEPTNDLDLATLRVLEDALLVYPGCVLVVSHDRWFLDRVTTAVLAFQGQGKLILYEGGHADWRAHQASGSEPSPSTPLPKPSTSKTSAPSANRKRTRRTFKEQQEFEIAEANIEAKEAAIEELEMDLSSPDTIRSLGPNLATELQRLESMKVEVETLYTRWEELGELSPYGG
ncbi:MAG: ABC-F family ATP-binding cassette domain-containing protein [Myxococcales bacterium]|nr:ABC-F family ATP-binding cassette domain-containing protein [Myxococcales bacterium]